MMSITPKLLQELLVRSKMVSPKEFAFAATSAKETGARLEDVLLEQNLISRSVLGKLLGEKFKVPYSALSERKIPPQVLEIIPEVVARNQRIIAFEKTAQGIKVASSDPTNLEVLEHLERKTGEKVIPFFATESEIQHALKNYELDVESQFKAFFAKPTRQAQEIVDLLLKGAWRNRASDVHMEPSQHHTTVRFRIDGILHDIVEIPRMLHDNLISRLKIMAKLRTDEHQAAQDGHFFFAKEGEKLDVRVSIVPIEEGEKAVLRLLSLSLRRLSLEELGFDEKQFQIVKRNIGKPWGMVLSAGPTGSGKTTTMYAILQILNTREVNIATIEDPIEYDIGGISQIQVNPQTNLTFAKGLKAILRQDPDIIMVGEIRDEETALLAVNAAMTGHQVFSTFHANDAASSLVRLVEIGVEPFLITSTVNLVIAQRLVRKICSSCIVSAEESFRKIQKILGKAGRKGNMRVFQGKGCPRCQGTGYLGRTGIFELLEMSESIRKLVLEKSSAFEIVKTAKKQGMKTMLEHGLEKVEQGITTVEEIARTIR